jgi:hypothetical protein
MDDGSKKKSGIIIHTDSFLHFDVIRLILVLKNKFNLEANVVIKKSLNCTYNLIYIQKNSMVKLNYLVLPYMCNSMLRKLHLNI